MTNSPHRYYLAAGGTGGHVMPALSLAERLIQHHHHVVMIVDKRARPLLPAALPRKQIQAASPFSGSVLARIFALIRLALGFIDIFMYLIRHRPHAIIGFGGYPTFAPILSGWLLRIPVFIHEQNAVIGRANLHLCRFASLLMLSWPKTQNCPPHIRTIVTGLPTRHDFAMLAPYKPAKKKLLKPKAGHPKFHLAIFGGSLGAAIFAHTIPQALTLLPPPLKAQLVITHQVRPAQKPALDAFYRQHNIKAHTSPFFSDVSQIMGQADLLICRAGASSVAEVAQSGRPALFIPFAAALDNHQTANAQQLSAHGAAICMAEHAATPETIKQTIENLMGDAAMRKSLARKASQHAHKDAAFQMMHALEGALNTRPTTTAATTREIIA